MTLGPTLRHTGSCFVANAIGGTAVSVSLPSLLPQSFTGCSLLVRDNVLDVVVPSDGVAEPSSQIPSTPALAFPCPQRSGMLLA